MTSPRRIAVVGLGYVGLPVACAFAKAGFQVMGFDIDRERVQQLCRGEDRTSEVEPQDLRAPSLTLTHGVDDLRVADFFIIAVPTPVDDARQPDISMVIAASQTVGKVLKRGDLVVYESTVYPGATEEDCLPVLESASGLKGGVDFAVGFSPERINPGDRNRRFETITKVVSGQNAEALDVIAETYGAVVTAGVHRAPSIKAAEAAKVIENTQRDLNIALMNELSMIFQRMGIDTQDVLEAAGTKWNFLPFTPGLVGGHCIGVDPYYLTHKAERLNYNPLVVLAGRRVNDAMGQHVARECVRRLMRLGRGDPIVTVLGITFKEDVPDIRNSKVADMVGELQSYGVTVQVADPRARPADVRHEYGLELREVGSLDPADAIIVAVAHREFKAGGWRLIRGLLRGETGVVLDVKWLLDRQEKPAGIDLWRL